MAMYALHPLFSRKLVRVGVPEESLSDSGFGDPPSGDLLQKPTLKPLSELPEVELAEILENIRIEGGTLEDPESGSVV